MIAKYNMFPRLIFGQLICIRNEIAVILQSDMWIWIFTAFGSCLSNCPKFSIGYCNASVLNTRSALNLKNDHPVFWHIYVSRRWIIHYTWVIWGKDHCYTNFQRAAEILDAYSSHLSICFLIQMLFECGVGHIDWWDGGDMLVHTAACHSFLCIQCHGG